MPFPPARYRPFVRCPSEPVKLVTGFPRVDGCVRILTLAEEAIHTSGTIGEEIRERLGGMTPAERRVARTLLETYPTAGLKSLPRLAEGAGVTGPTVLRFVRKIGFDGYPDFQRSLRDEVQARSEGLHSLYETKGPTGSTTSSGGARRRSRAH